MTTENGQLLAEVGTIDVLRHSKGPCRHCGHEFEQKGGRFGCGCSGVAVHEPLNHNGKTDGTR